MSRDVRRTGGSERLQARGPDGDLVTEHQAKARGLNFLACPICERRLRRIAASRRARAHFRHLSGYCDGRGHIGAETWAHFMAKELILQLGRAFLPASLSAEVRYEGPTHGLRLTPFDDPEVEPFVGGYRPDLLVRVRNQPVAIEVKVSSACALEKLRKFAELGIYVVEVELSRHASSSLREIRQALCVGATWNCLFDPCRGGSGYLQSSQAMLRSDLEIERFLAATKPLQATLQMQTGARAPTILTGVELLDATDTSYFAVSADTWQEAVLSIFCSRASQPVHLYDILRALVNANAIAREHVALSAFSLRRLRHDDGLPPGIWHGRHPLADQCATLGAEEVHLYLVWLAEQDVLHAVPSGCPVGYAENWMMPANVAAVLT